MKSILISIKPKWVAKILNGEKTIEIRKTMPKCDFPIDVYIYMTKNGGNLGCGNCVLPYLNGKVVAKFTLNTVKEWHNYSWFEITKKGCVSDDELRNYSKGKASLYIWHIDNLVIFDKPKELSEFRHFVWLRNEYIFPNQVCDMCEFPHCKDCARHYCLVPLTKAPQNFCYVEVE